MRTEPSEGRVSVNDIQELVLAEVVDHARRIRAGGDQGISKRCWRRRLLTSSASRISWT